MISLVACLCVFLAAVLTHAACVRANISSSRSLNAIPAALFWLVVLWLFLFFLAPAASLKLSALWLYILFCVTYANELLVVEDRSPSLEIVRLLQQHPEGLTLEDLSGRFPDERWIARRLDYLAEQGYLKREGAEYVLEPRCLKIIGLVAFYRGLIGRGLGG